MDLLLLGLVLGFVVSGVFAVGIAFARAGGLGRAWWGLTVAGRCQHDPALQGKVNALLGGAAVEMPPTPPAPAGKPVTPPLPAKPSGEPLRLLTILQAESRLVDFLMEDVSGATDEQIGQGVREVHKKASAAIRKYLQVEPVLGGAEGDTVTVPKGFDPSAVRVVGNVTGEPPYSGELQHPGWRVKEIKLPSVAEGQDPFVVQPAEVQIG